MVKTIYISGRRYSYELKRRSMKNLRMRIGGSGRLIVSAPMYVSLYEMETFIRDNEGFILRSLKKAQNDPPPQYIEDGGTVYIAGRGYPVKVLESEKNAVLLDNDVLYILVRDVNDIVLIVQEAEKYLRELCLKRMQEYTQSLFPYFAARGKKLPQVRLRRMRSCWGNCRPQSGIITYNSALIGAPEECMEYVAAHELTHLLHPDHSRDFYDELSQIMPDWKARRERLKEYSRVLIF